MDVDFIPSGMTYVFDLARQTCPPGYVATWEQEYFAWYLEHAIAPAELLDEGIVRHA